MSGVGGALVVFVILGLVGVLGSGVAGIPVAFLQFLAQLASGFVAGRLAGRDHVLHGGVAGIAFHGVTSTIALAAAPDAVPLVALVAFGVVAAVLGAAGGALARARP